MHTLYIPYLFYHETVSIIGIDGSPFCSDLDIFARFKDISELSCRVFKILKIKCFISSAVSMCHDGDLLMTTGAKWWISCRAPEQQRDLSHWPSWLFHPVLC